MKQTVTVKLEKHEKMEATGITIPFDVEAVFGSMRGPLRAVVNGAEYRGTIVMGGKYMLGIPRAFRRQLASKRVTTLWSPWSRIYPSVPPQYPMILPGS